MHHDNLHPQKNNPFHPLSLQGVAGSDGLPGENGEPVSLCSAFFPSALITQNVVGFVKGFPFSRLVFACFYFQGPFGPVGQKGEVR